MGSLNHESLQIVFSLVLPTRGRRAAKATWKWTENKESSLQATLTAVAIVIVSPGLQKTPDKWYPQQNFYLMVIKSTNLYFEILGGKTEINNCNEKE